MKKQQLYEELSLQLLSTLKKYNLEPSHGNEDELHYLVNSFNEFIKNTELRKICWVRDNKSSLYIPISVFYIPFGEIEN